MAVTALLILMMAASAMLMRHLTLQDYRDSHRFSWSQIALNLAESGIQASLSALRTTDPESPLIQVLLSERAEAVNGRRLGIESEILTELAGLLGPQAELEVYIELDGFRALHPSTGLRGVLSDGKEKYGEITLVSRARYQGVVHRMVAAKQVKVVRSLVPVLSKFSLFSQDRVQDDVNILEYQRLRPQEGFRSQGSEASPLVLYNRPEPTPAVAEGSFVSLFEQLSEVPPDDGGLVFLGGDRPWVLNLLHGMGVGRHEESYHLRRARYLFPSEVQGVRTELGLQFGFYSGILASPKFGSYQSPAALPREASSGDVTDKTSALHLYGDVFHASPTPVFGPVFRSFLEIRLLDGLWYPTRSEAEFRSAKGVDAFQGRYDLYRTKMVRVVEEAYNRGFDAMVSNQEELLPEGRVEAHETPYAPEPTLIEATLTRVRPIQGDDAMFLYPDPGQPALGAMQLHRIGPDSAPLFRGALRDLDGEVVETLLAAKTCYTVANQEEFLARYLGGNQLQLDGVVRIQEGGLELPSVRAGKGGMIVAPGTIRLTGIVQQDSPEAPLSLVSLNGDIEVTSGEKIDAHLVAMRGTLRHRGSLNLVGGLAVQTLDLESLVQGSGNKSITYNFSLDPTRGENDGNHLRLVLDKELRMYLDKREAE